jgi:hypothetical protein
VKKPLARENGSLVLRFEDLIVETRAMRELAAPFLSEDSRRLLLDHESGLNDFAASKATRGWLEIPESRPVATLVSDGYKPNTGGGLGLIGTLSGSWEIEKLDPGDRASRGKFRTVGLASWVVTLRLENEPETVAARWTFDLGAPTAPGCFFHVQVEPAKTLANGKTSDLDVPRLPSMLITPMDALAFLLGELFQDEWPITAEDGSRQQVKTFRARQLVRVERLLSWCLEKMNRGSGIPWANLKSAMPDNLEMY